MTLGEFQAFITDFRSMTRDGNSIKPNLSLHNMKVALSLAPYQNLEVHQTAMAMCKG